MLDLMCNQYDKIEELGHTDDEFYDEYFRIYELLPWWCTMWYFFGIDDTWDVYLKASENDSWIEKVLGCRKCFGASSC